MIYQIKFIQLQFKYNNKSKNPKFHPKRLMNSYQPSSPPVSQSYQDSSQQYQLIPRQQIIYQLRRDYYLEVKSKPFQFHYGNQSNITGKTLQHVQHKQIQSQQDDSSKHSKEEIGQYHQNYSNHIQAHQNHIQAHQNHIQANQNHIQTGQQHQQKYLNEIQTDKNNLQCNENNILDDKNNILSDKNNFQVDKNNVQVGKDDLQANKKHNQFNIIELVQSKEYSQQNSQNNLSPTYDKKQAIKYQNQKYKIEFLQQISLKPNYSQDSLISNSSNYSEHKIEQQKSKTNSLNISLQKQQEMIRNVNEIDRLRSQLVRSTNNNINTIFGIDFHQDQCLFHAVKAVNKQVSNLCSKVQNIQYQLESTTQRIISNNYNYNQQAYHKNYNQQSYHNNSQQQKHHSNYNQQKYHKKQNQQRYEKKNNKQQVKYNNESGQKSIIIDLGKNLSGQVITIYPKGSIPTIQQIKYQQQQTRSSRSSSFQLIKQLQLNFFNNLKQFKQSIQQSISLKLLQLKSSTKQTQKEIGNYVCRQKVLLEDKEKLILKNQKLIQQYQKINQQNHKFIQQNYNFKLKLQQLQKNYVQRDNFDKIQRLSQQTNDYDQEYDDSKGSINIIYIQKLRELQNQLLEKQIFMQRLQKQNFYYQKQLQKYKQIVEKTRLNSLNAKSCEKQLNPLDYNLKAYKSLKNVKQSHSITSQYQQQKIAQIYEQFPLTFKKKNTHSFHYQSSNQVEQLNNTIRQYQIVIKEKQIRIKDLENTIMDQLENSTKFCHSNTSSSYINQEIDANILKAKIHNLRTLLKQANKQIDKYKQIHANKSINTNKQIHTYKQSNTNKQMNTNKQTNTYKQSNKYNKYKQSNKYNQIDMQKQIDQQKQIQQRSQTRVLTKQVDQLITDTSKSQCRSDKTTIHAQAHLTNPIYPFLQSLSTQNIQKCLLNFMMMSWSLKQIISKQYVKIVNVQKINNNARSFIRQLANQEQIFMSSLRHKIGLHQFKDMRQQWFSK